LEREQRLYDPQVRQIRLVGSVVEDERQLDGSRHVEIVGDDEQADLALRFVVDRDGMLREAELSLEVNGTYVVLGFDEGLEVGGEEQLSVQLRGPQGTAEVAQRVDGDVGLEVTLSETAEPGE
jgi:hypothetical protein